MYHSLLTWKLVSRSSMHHQSFLNKVVIKGDEVITITKGAHEFGNWQFK